MKTYLWMGMLMVMSICKAHEGRNFVHSDMLKTMSANDKAAIVMVYFGTTHDDTRALTIDRLTEQVQETFPDFKVREAYTSRTVIQRLAKRDITKKTPLEELDWLKRHGYTHVIVQPTTLIEGVEMEALRREVAGVSGDFKDIRVGTPLLYTPDDYRAVAATLGTVPSDGRAVVWVGHGTYIPATAQYAMLGDVMNVEGHEHHFVVTLEGYPMLSDTEARIRKSGAERVVLCPLMFVAGDHAKNDIAGEMKEQLEAKGHQVETILKGLGEYEGIRAVFIDHIRFSLHHKMTDIVERKKVYATPGYEYRHDE